MTAIAPKLYKLMAQAVQGKAQRTGYGGALHDSGAIYRVLALAAAYITMLMLPHQAIICRWHPIWMSFVSTNGNLEVILEGEDVSGEILL